MDTLTPLLLDAKEEYLGQVTDVLAPFVLTALRDLYVDAQKHKGKVLLSFQRALREIPTWNSHVVRQRTQEIEVRYKSLGKLIAALFVSVVKIMSTIRLNRERPNIRLKLPSNDAFVHQVYIQTAREFYQNPHLINESRGTRIATVKEGVRAAVREMLPIDDILTAYLGGTVDGDNTMSPLPDDGSSDDDETPAPPPAPEHKEPETPAEEPPAEEEPADDDDDAEDADESTRDINLHHGGGLGGGSVVVPSTQPDPDAAPAHGSDDPPAPPAAEKKKEFFSDAEDDF